MKEPHSCFVIMPFCDTEHEAKGQKRKIAKSRWDHIYQKWIKRAVESYPQGKIASKRSPAKPGSFIKGIVVDLSEADLVIADLTGARPNVYYELVDHRRLFNEISLTNEKLEANLNNDLQPQFFNYLISLLGKAAEAKENFNKQWDTIIQAVDAIKLQKKAAANDSTP
jgi:hypothetical protein